MTQALAVLLGLFLGWLFEALLGGWATPTLIVLTIVLIRQVRRRQLEK